MYSPPDDHYCPREAQLEMDVIVEIEVEIEVTVAVEGTNTSNPVIQRYRRTVFYPIIQSYKEHACILFTLFSFLHFFSLIYSKIHHGLLFFEVCFFRGFLLGILPPPLLQPEQPLHCALRPVEPLFFSSLVDVSFVFLQPSSFSPRGYLFFFF
ncbi:hypothetical protein EX30DRAFT_54821 [Ascodesmis nigricans]|uniref:Uncharacterized protein n=1 Tax=Ascodesmis nigricans TaxID=341454 RepID=A0A4S2MVE0_9PEZI|nr:hypothetical protein EX30DRAFT_54821 [Ascodesmis nigricans]